MVAGDGAAARNAFGHDRQGSSQALSWLSDWRLKLALSSQVGVCVSSSMKSQKQQPVRA